MWLKFNGAVEAPRGT